MYVEELIEQIDIYTEICDAKAQADNGELIDGQTALSRLKEKYEQND